MTTATVLLLIVSAIVAFGISFYQYIFKAGKKSRILFFLAFLRFLTLFSVFVLLINPILTTKDFETVKTPLPVVVDNSASIAALGQDSLTQIIMQEISDNKALKDKYDLQVYSFDESFRTGAPTDFKGRQTHIDNAANNLKQLYRNAAYPVVLLTDGNQTIGNDYVYSFDQNTAVFPLVLGDTTLFTDVKVNQVNVNKYALLKNKFPVEVFLQYSGTSAVSANFSIIQGTTVLHKENVSFSPDNKAQSLSVLLNADKVGVQTYRAVVSPLADEKNTYNNVKNFAVEVIDQRSEIAIVSSVNHPDLGALKRSIEVNQQRKVTIIKPEAVKNINDYNVLVLYQPDGSFKNILEQNSKAGVNTFIITGLHTDFALLNTYQDQVGFKMSSQSEDYLADFNQQFNLFSLENIGFEQLPPLRHPFGTITANANADVLLEGRIRNVKTENPLLLFAESGNSRTAFLMGENIWKWRLETNANKGSSDEFDIFIDKTIQFLSSDSKRKSLVVNHESFYNSGEVIAITAQYFNKNYEFDDNARLTIVIKDKASNTSKTYDFLRGNNNYKVNLDGLDPGQYTFTVKESTSNTSYSGAFEVLDFEIEKQFVNPDLLRLNQVAEKMQGAVYYPNQVKSLIDELVNNESYKPVQKEITKKSPLIDWIWLLVLLSVLLATEWFVRKYNGLL